MPNEALQFAEQEFSKEQLGQQVSEAKVDGLKMKVANLKGEIKQLKELGVKNKDGANFQEKTITDKLKKADELQQALEDLRTMTAEQYEQLTAEYDKQVSVLAEHADLKFQTYIGDDVGKVLQSLDGQTQKPEGAIVNLDKSSPEFNEQIFDNEWRLRKGQDLTLRDEQGVPCLKLKSRLLDRIFDSVSIQAEVKIQLMEKDGDKYVQGPEKSFFKISYGGREWYVEKEKFEAKEKKTDSQPEKFTGKNTQIYNEKLSMGIDAGKSQLIDRIYDQVGQFEPGKSSKIFSYQYAEQNGNSLNLEMTFDGHDILMRKNLGEGKFDTQIISLSNLNLELNRALLRFLNEENGGSITPKNFDEKTSIEQFPDIDLIEFPDFDQVEHFLNKCEAQKGTEFRGTYKIADKIYYLAGRHYEDGRKEYYISDSLNLLEGKKEDGTKEKRFFAKVDNKEEFLGLLGADLDSPKKANVQSFDWFEKVVPQQIAEKSQPANTPEATKEEEISHEIITQLNTILNSNKDGISMAQDYLNGIEISQGVDKNKLFSVMGSRLLEVKFVMQKLEFFRSQYSTRKSWQDFEQKVFDRVKIIIKQLVQLKQNLIEGKELTINFEANMSLEEAAKIHADNDTSLADRQAQLLTDRERTNETMGKLDLEKRDQAYTGSVDLNVLIEIQEPEEEVSQEKESAPLIIQDTESPQTTMDKFKFINLLDEKYGILTDKLGGLSLNQALVVPLPTFIKGGHDQFVTIVKRGNDLYQLYPHGFEDGMTVSAKFYNAETLKQGLINIVEEQDLLPEHLRRPGGLEEKIAEPAAIEEEFKEPEGIATSTAPVASERQESPELLWEEKSKDRTKTAIERLQNDLRKLRALVGQDLQAKIDPLNTELTQDWEHLNSQDKSVSGQVIEKYGIFINDFDTPYPEKFNNFLISKEITLETKKEKTKKEPSKSKEGPQVALVINNKQVKQALEAPSLNLRDQFEVFTLKAQPKQLWNTNGELLSISLPASVVDAVYLTEGQVFSVDVPKPTPKGKPTQTEKMEFVKIIYAGQEFVIRKDDLDIKDKTVEEKKYDMKGTTEYDSSLGMNLDSAKIQCYKDMLQVIDGYKQLKPDQTDDKVHKFIINDGSTQIVYEMIYHQGNVEIYTGGEFTTLFSPNKDKFIQKFIKNGTEKDYQPSFDKRPLSASFDKFPDKLPAIEASLDGFWNLYGKIKALANSEELVFKISGQGEGAKDQYVYIAKSADGKLKFISSDNADLVQASEGNFRQKDDAELKEIFKTLRDMMGVKLENTAVDLDGETGVKFQTLQNPIYSPKRWSEFLTGEGDDKFGKIMEDLPVGKNVDISLPGDRKLTIYKRAENLYELRDKYKFQATEGIDSSSTFEFKNLDDLKVDLDLKYKEKSAGWRPLDSSIFEATSAQIASVKASIPREIYGHPDLILNGPKQVQTLSSDSEVQSEPGPDNLGKYPKGDVELAYEYLKVNALNKIKEIFINAQDGVITKGDLIAYGVKEPARFLGLFTSSLSIDDKRSLGAALFISAMEGINLNPGEGDPMANQSDLLGDTWDFYALDIQDKVKNIIQDLTKKTGPIVVLDSAELPASSEAGVAETVSDKQTAVTSESSAETSISTPERSVISETLGRETGVSNFPTIPDFDKFSSLALGNNSKNKGELLNFVTEPVNGQRISSPRVKVLEIMGKNADGNQVPDKKYMLMMSADGKIMVFRQETGETENQKWVQIAVEGNNGDKSQLRQVLEGEIREAYHSNVKLMKSAKQKEAEAKKDLAKAVKLKEKQATIPVKTKLLTKIDFKHYSHYSQDTYPSLFLRCELDCRDGTTKIVDVKIDSWLADSNGRSFYFNVGQLENALQLATQEEFKADYALPLPKDVHGNVTFPVNGKLDFLLHRKLVKAE